MNSLNPFKNTRIEFHILQSFPVTCLNRDDVGAPKTAVIGGSIRARVSSQCWKRQVRLALHEFGIKLAIRSKKINDYIAKACLVLGATEEQAQACAKSIADVLTKDTLLFFTEGEACAFANYAKECQFDSAKLENKAKKTKTEKKNKAEKDKKNEIFKISKEVLNLAHDGLDIALFGRMVASAPSMHVEAAASFSHAISTHKVINEVEFFTALDDLAENDHPVSAHMGSLEFNAATYYRYISLDLGQLSENLGSKDEELHEAVLAFIKALFIALPSARQTTQSGASPWEFAKIYFRKGQRLQVPFETAVKANEGGFLQPSIIALKDYLIKKEKLAGSLFGKKSEYTFGDDESFCIDDLLEKIKEDLCETI